MPHFMDYLSHGPTRPNRQPAEWIYCNSLQPSELVWVGIEYLLDGERVYVYFDSPRPDLPIVQRGGAIRFYRWGARRPCYFADENMGGAKRFPEESCAPLEDIKSGKWASYDPQPVRILTSRIIQLDLLTLGPAYFPLKRGEFIQGLLASIRDNQRVYVVTVPAPAQYAERWPDWPRIVTS